MMNKLMKKIMPVMFAALVFATFGMSADAAQMEETTQESEEEAEAQETDELSFEIGTFTYRILPDAVQDDMPSGFTLGDWEYQGKAVKAGFTENSDMICVMADDVESGYSYRFIYDPDHELFVPYFGTDIKDGYIYTIPMYEGAEIPFGFEEGYYVIQTVPMFVYQREDAELTSEEIALGILSDDSYLVFLMMDQDGKEVYYTYDLVDRSFQRALLQVKDAESLAEKDQLVDDLHKEISDLNAMSSERLNRRLAIIGVLIAAVVIMAGIIINLLIKISGLKKGENPPEPYEEEEFEEETSQGGLLGFFKKKDTQDYEDEEYEDEEYEDEDREFIDDIDDEVNEDSDDDDELEILDLDLED